VNPARIKGILLHKRTKRPDAERLTGEKFILLGNRL
jgi:hypothetical protein